MATTYMNLSLPTPTLTIGPTWATQLNTALEYVDSHDHTTNKGKQIPSAALNINANLDLGGYSPYNALSLKFSSQSSTLTGASNASSVYVVSGNLYFTNGSGTAVQVTSGGSLAAAPGATISLEKTGPIAGDLIIVNTDTFVIVEMDTTAVRQVTLPATNTVTDGRIYVIKDISGSANANNITLVPDGADTIDGESSLVIDSDYSSVMIIGDGTSNWDII